MIVNQDFQGTSSHHSTGQYTQLKQGAARLAVKAAKIIQQPDPSQPMSWRSWTDYASCR